jgi:hypothetical protein
MCRLWANWIQTIFFQRFLTFLQNPYNFYQNSRNQHFFSDLQPLFFRSIFSILAYSTGNTPPPTGRSRSGPPPKTQPHPKMGFFMPTGPAVASGWACPISNKFQNLCQQFSEVLTTIFRFNSEVLTTFFRSLNNKFQKSSQQFLEVISTNFRSPNKKIQQSEQHISELIWSRDTWTN